MKKLIHSKPKVLIRCNALLAEGPIWNHHTNELTFVDILKKNIFIYKDKKKIKKFKLREMISNFLPSKNNCWISCGKDKVFKIKIYCQMRLVLKLL